MTAHPRPVTKDANSVNGVNGVNGTNSNHHGGPPSSPSPMPIAVVGMACRFAGDATSPSKLWDLCASGRDAWSTIPSSRFDVASFYDANKEKPGRNHSTGGYFLHEDIALFDAAFFSLTAEAASAMDPQLRLLLEVVYEATEDAGIPLSKLAGPEPNTSVFTGCYTKDYHDLLAREPESMPASTLTGNYTAMFSNRVSHFYDFQGASMSIDTGCSAALAALHQACQTIRSGESKVSVVGAPNTILNPDIYIAMSSLSMVGANGRCYAWDSRAEGYGRGEGVAVLMLKSLDAAIREGDRVHAVIRETGLNQDGRTTTITSPSMDAQVRLIRSCYRRAGLDLADTGYVEAHMTGTQAGDATEAESLARTFGQSRAAADPVWVGSVKTNVGHTEGVSGLAGIIKTAMAMKHRAIPPNLNYAVGNAKIPLKEWRLQVPTSLVPWPRDKPLRASINNFGYGGTNAHVILEAAPPAADMVEVPGTDDDGTSRLYLLSGQDPAAVKAAADALTAHIQQLVTAGSVPSARDLAFTLAERRTRLSWVAAVRARSVGDLAAQLDKGGIKIALAPPGKPAPRLGFVFNGQGAQWAAMGRELLGAYPVFARAVSEANAALRRYGACWSLREELERDAKSTRINEIHLGQPITVALQICLVVLLRSWGIRPSAVTSHSSGEIAAAYAAGALSFDQALGVTFWRGELARTLIAHDSSGVVGGMAAAGLGPEQAERYLKELSSGDKVVVACVNSPESVTLSGDVAELDKVVAQLEADGHFARKLKVPLAYHSQQMLRMGVAYLEKLETVVPSRPTWAGPIVYSSPVTGGIISAAEELGPSHYVRNLTNPVLFSQAFEAMCFGADGASAAQVDAVVEIGPHGTLSAPIRQILRGRKMPYVTCLQRPMNAVETMQDAAGDLLRLGYPVRLDAINHAGASDGVPGFVPPNFVPDLPTYPWNHTTRHWVESRVNRDIRFKRHPPHPLLGVPISGATHPAWRSYLNLVDLPWVADHRVDGAVVLPGAAYVSMAIEAVRLVSNHDSPKEGACGYHVRDVAFLNALAILESHSAARGVEMELHLTPCHTDQMQGWYEFEVRSLGVSNTWVENCRGLVSTVTDPQELPNEILAGAKTFLGEGGESAGSTGSRKLDGPSLRTRVADMGVEYGPAFRGIANTLVSTSMKRAVSDLVLQGPEGNGLTESEEAQDFASYVIHPTTLDCIIQATYANLLRDTGKEFMVLPKTIHSLVISNSLPRQAAEGLVVFSELKLSQRQGFTSVVSASDDRARENTTALLQMEGLFCQAIPRVVEREPSIPLWRSQWALDMRCGVPDPAKETMRITLSEEDVDWEKKATRASYYLIHDAVASLQDEDTRSWTDHGRALFHWMQAVVALAKTGQLAPGSRVWGRATPGVKHILFDELKRHGGGQGSLLVHIGQKLADVVRGATLPEPLAGQYYLGMPRLQARSLKHLALLARGIAVVTPGCRVLDVGLGAGGVAHALLEACAQGGTGGNLVDQYILANVPDAQRQPIANSLAAWHDIVDVRDLDFEGDDAITSTQLPAQSMDIVIASMVSHATENLKQVLGKLHALLKPSGVLILVEPTADRLDMQLVFSALSGWRQGTLLASSAKVEDWDTILRANDFIGVDLHMADCEQPQYEGLTVMAARPVGGHGGEGNGCPSSGTRASIVVRAPSAGLAPPPAIVLLTEAVQKAIRMPVVVENWTDFRPTNDKISILATDDVAGQTVLDAMDEETFDKVVKALLNSRAVVWLTCRGGDVGASSPAQAQVQGLLRTLRQEDASKPYILIDLPQGWSRKPEGFVNGISRIIQQALDASVSDVGAVDSEFALDELGGLYVPRVCPNLDDSKPQPDHRAPFHQEGRVLVWQDSPPGDGQFVDALNNMTKGNLDGFVEIKTEAFSPCQNSQHHGTSPGDGDDSPGIHEVAGTVTAIGCHPGTTRLRVGDSVCGIARGPFASTTRLLPTSIARVPEALSLEQAACIPLAYSSALFGLSHVARLQKGESVLVLAAAGDPHGQAAVAVAKHLGGDVLVAPTSVSGHDSEALAAKCDLTPCRVLSAPGTGSFADAIMSRTQGRGISVVFYSASVPLLPHRLQSSLEVLGRFGRFVEVGGAGGSPNKVAPVPRCATYARIDVEQLSDHDGPLMREILEDSLRIAAESPASQPLLSSVRVFSVSQLKKALQHLVQGYSGAGPLEKVVVVPEVGDRVRVGLGVPRLSLDQGDSTYLVVGGVGAIGGAVALWMASQGAKNVLLMSRNAESHDGALGLVEEAAESGCRLQLVNCDVANEESVVDALARACTSSPPIRGVLHAAAVLEDAVLERMTLAQWKCAVAPKIAGTTNLRKHLPADCVSFFVVLSSVTGLAGHLSQANYAAANCFQDAWCRQQAAAGYPAVSIALPAVTGAGMVAEDEASHRRIEALGTASMPVGGVLSLIGNAIMRVAHTRGVGTRPEATAEVIAGLRPWSVLPAEATVRRDRRFGTLRLAGTSADAAGDASLGDADAPVNPAALLAQGLAGGDKTQAAQALAARLGGIFNIPVETVDLSVPVAAHGVDSLVAVDLRNWLASVAKAKLSIFDILQSPSLMEFAGLVLERSVL